MTHCVLRAVGLGVVLGLLSQLTDSTAFSAGIGYLFGAAAVEFGLYEDSGGGK